uniref:Uncharacterized protein n=1 Tax=Acrobeloides nanus TaxID=290746 RepID=A0A914CKP1_9BILA
MFIQTIIVPIFIIINEDRLMHKLRPYLCQNKVHQQVNNPTTLTGKPLIINRNQHQDIYFNAYQSSWS